MTQAFYAHMNNKIKTEKKLKTMLSIFFTAEMIGLTNFNCATFFKKHIKA
jgi:hypothetical protein